MYNVSAPSPHFSEHLPFQEYLVFRAVIPLISTAMEPVLQFRALSLYLGRFETCKIIKLCPPTWDHSPPSGYSLLFLLIISPALL